MSNGRKAIPPGPPWGKANGCSAMTSLVSWNDWLQRYRIELNAMAPGKRIAWLTEKIQQHPPRKVVPPSDVLHLARLRNARVAINDELTKRARIAERTEEILTGIEWSDQGRLPKVVTRFLDRKRHRKASWTRPMEVAGIKAAKRAVAKIPEDKTNSEAAP